MDTSGRALHTRAVGRGAAILGMASLLLGATLAAAGQPAEAADRAELAFQNAGRIYALQADGSGRRLLTDPGSRRASDAEPAWSPDGAMLAISHQVEFSAEDVRSRIQLVQADGSDRRSLTALTRGGSVSSPRWSPDGQRLAFVRFKARGESYTSSIVVHELRTGAQRTVASQPLRSRFESIAEPDWSPDGRIVYTRFELDRRADFRPSLYVVDANGAGRRLLVRDGQSADFSPDGSRIAFASVRDRNGSTCGSDECSRNGEIYVMDASGANRRRLTRNKGHDAGPRWSRDGDRIAFASNRNFPDGDGFELYSIRPDGGCLTWLTNGTPQSFSPDWRPVAGSSDPGGCGATPRPPLVELDLGKAMRFKGPSLLWLGQSFRGLLLTEVASVRQGIYLGYQDCAFFDPSACPAGLQLTQTSVCARDSYLPSLNTNFERYSRRRGAFVVDFGAEGGLDAYTGGLEVSLRSEDGRARAARAALQGLRRFGSAARPSRLAPAVLPRQFVRELRRVAVAHRRLGSAPAVARQLGISRARVRRRLAIAKALRPYGPFRTLRCPTR